MKKGVVQIVGPIGTFMYGGKLIKGVHLVDLVARVNALPADTEEIEFHIATPGGSKDEGKAMYTYIKELGLTKNTVSRQIGDIDSVGTIFWFGSKKKIACKGINAATGEKYRFLLHNPWTPHEEGDAEHLAKRSEEIKATELEFEKFYSEQTGLTETVVSPLMAITSKFDADQAVNLKFADETYEASNIAAYNPMEKQKPSLVTELIAFLQGKKADKIVAAAPPAELMGKPVMVGGAAAPDGVYSVKGGVVTALESLEEEVAEPAAAASSAPVALTAESIATIIAAETKKQELAFEQKLNDIKKSVKGTHVPLGFSQETKVEDAKEWDRLHKSGELVMLKKDDPDKANRLHYAKWGKMPNQ